MTLVREPVPWRGWRMACPGSAAAREEKVKRAQVRAEVRPRMVGVWCFEFSVGEASDGEDEGWCL